MKTTHLIGGDLRPAAIEKQGWQVKRGHPFDPKKGHGFIDIQKYGTRMKKTVREGERLNLVATRAGLPEISPGPATTFP